MPAYPFSQQPLFSEFRRILEEYGCDYVTLECYVGTDESYGVPYFARDVGDRRLTAVAIYEDNARVPLSDMRRICHKLEVPAETFGLTLTDWL